MKDKKFWLAFMKERSEYRVKRLKKELEEKNSKEALVLVQKKHSLIKCQSEREKVRILQRLGGTRAIRRSDAQDTFSFES